MTQDLKLSKCPCCPPDISAETYMAHGFGSYSVKCLECGITTPQYGGMDKAAAAWNTRSTSDSAAVQRVDGLSRAAAFSEMYVADDLDQYGSNCAMCEAYFTAGVDWHIQQTPSAAEVQELVERIEAAKLRLSEAKAKHSRWYEMPRHEAEKYAHEQMTNIEQIIYSAVCYLDGLDGPNRALLAKHEKRGE